MNMKKILTISIGLIFTGIFSSCLKDSTYMDVSNTEPIIEFGQSAANGIYGPNGYYGAFIYNPTNFSVDTNIVANDTTIYNVIQANDTAVALILASPQVLNDTVVATLKIDTTQITAFNTANGTAYTSLPTNLYNIPSLVDTILPGHRVGSVSVNILPFPQSLIHYNYALPLALVNAVDINNAKNEIIVSGNSGTFMWLFTQ